MSTYHTSIGSPSEREHKVYKTPAGAKQWCRAKLSEFAEWGKRYNPDLSVEAQDVSKTIDGINMEALDAHERRSWQMKDHYSGFTMVVELWREP